MSLQLIGASLLAALEGYVCGSIVFGILISKLFFHDDVRTHGSGSAGMTNMLRTYGIPAGAATAIGDVAKGAVAVFMHAPRMSDRAMSKRAAICDLRNFMVQTSLACAIMRSQRKFNPRIDKNSSRR